MSTAVEAASPEAVLPIRDRASQLILDELGRRGLPAAADEHPADRLPRDAVLACVGQAIREHNDVALINGQPLFPDHAAGVAMVLAHLLGLGPPEPFLVYENWEDLWCMGPDRIFVRYGLPGGDGLAHEPGKYQLPVAYASTEHLVRTVKAHLGPLGLPWDTAHPTVDGMLSGTVRIHASLPVIGREAYVCLRHLRQQVTLLPDLVARGMLDLVMATFLDSVVKLGLTVLIVGGTGSGKTTLLNALLLLVTSRHEHLLIIEQQPELRVAEPRFRQLVPHVTAKWTRPGGPDGAGAVTMTDLVHDGLREAPTRIIVGELRGSEARAWLWAARTGHKGSMASIHGESCADGLDMCRFYYRMDGHGDLPDANLVELIARTVDLVIYLETDERDGTRRVVEIAETASYVPAESRGGSGRVALNPLFIWDEAAGRHRWTGTRPRCTEALRRRGLPLGIDLAAPPAAAGGIAGETAVGSR